MNEAKIAAAVERWRTSGLGITLPDSEYTAQEQQEIIRRCEELVRAQPRRTAERRIHQG